MSDQPGRDYDAVIIGAGMGGLSSAIYLSQKGMKVLVIEQHRTPGGYVCGFKRKGYYFDGANISFSSHGIVYPLFREMGIIDRLKWNPHEISVKIPQIGLHFNYVSFDGFAGSMARQFAAEPNIGAYLDVLRSFYQFFEHVAAYKVPTIYFGFKRFLVTLGFTSLLFRKGMLGHLRNVFTYGKMSTLDLAGRFFAESSPAYKFFSSFGSPTQASLIMGAMINEFIKDKWYPTGGEQHLADVCAERAISLGAEFRYKELVTEIVTEGGKAVGVKTDKGSYRCAYVVSDSDYRRTFNQMLDDKSLIPADSRRRLDASGLSDSMYNLYIGARYSAEELREALNGNHTMFYPTLDPVDIAAQGDNEEFFKNTPLSIFSPSLIDPGLAPEGRQSIIVQCLSPTQWMGNWGNDDKVEYTRLKSKVNGQILANLKRLLPDIEERLEVMEAGTPRTYERYTLNSDGAYCAWSWEPGKSFWRKADRIHPETPVKNLFVVSDWNYKIGGFCATLISGKTLARRLRVPV